MGKVILHKKETSTMSEKTPKKTNKRVFTGLVISDKMDKTIVVQVSTRKKHPLYKKYIAHRNKYKAHDEKNECQVGDKVQIIESRPISKDKRWRLVKIIEKGKVI